MATSEMDYMNIGGVRYKEIAVTAANQTFGAQLLKLKPTWDTLTNEEKMRCAIYRGNGLLFTPSYIGLGMYSCILAYSTAAAINCMNIQSGEYWVWGSSAGLVDYSSTNHTNTLSLVLLSNY